VVVEDHTPEGRDSNDLLMGVFEGTPRTEQSFFGVDTGPNRIVLYQKNIEAHAENVAAEEGRSVEEIIRHEVRHTVRHEFGHYFGLDDEALEDV
jgi:predicted Zn-dependent protease with MMP-like domain